ncbi:MAG TPA: hypothetical protein VL463_32415 [Kofleriaceae bacterium]|nr:hypothetical protein [Kofleriaceae bacterium]
MLVAALANIAMGLGFAVLARDRVRADGPFAGPAFLFVVLHAAVVVAPVALYFYAVHPAWAWHYWVDPAHVPGLALVPLVVGHAALVIGGWYGGAMLIRREHRDIALYTLGGLAFVLLITTILLWHRLTTDAAFAPFHRGEGAGFLDVELGWAVITSLMAITGSTIYVALELLRDGRRVRSR